MLLTRANEIQIILESLEKKKKELIGTISKMRIWGLMSCTDLNNSEHYLSLKLELDILNNNIKDYQKLQN